MAKKIAVQNGENINNDGGKQNKTRRRCCTCCLVLLVVLLVIFGAAFGVGWYFGDKFTRENLDMSLSDTLGVLGDLYWTDDSDVVKNPYSEKDINGFYTQIKRNVLLKDDAEVDFDDALLNAVQNYFGGDVAAQSDDAAIGDDGAEGGEGGGEIAGGEEDGNDTSVLTGILVDMIAGVLNRDNIDLDRLNAYDEFDPATDEYIFVLNDKQLAAFVNAILKAILGNVDNIEEMDYISGMIDLRKVLSLKQIRFKAKNGTDDDGNSAVVASTADITLWLGLQDAAGQAASYYLKQAGFGWASGLVGWLGNVILPENIYITLTVPLYGDEQSVVTINDMTDGERNKANKLINGVISLTGSNISIESLLNDFTDMVKPYLEVAAQKMSFDGISNGDISIDFLDMLTGVASKSLGGDPLTKADFLYLLQAMLSDPAQQLKAIQSYRYQNMYIDGSGKAVYIEGGSTELTPIDYEQEFIKAIEDKYSVDFGDDASLADVLAMLGISLSSDGDMSVDPTDLCDILNAERLNASLDKDISELKLKVTDRMLGAALSSQLHSELTGSGSGFENLNVNLDAFTFIKKADKPNNLYAYIVAELDLKDMLSSLGGNGILGVLASNVLPETVLLTVTVDITESRAAGEPPDETQFMINTCANTDRALDTLGKLLPELDLGSVAQNIESMLNTMLDQMYKKLDIELVASTVEYDAAADEYDGENGYMVLPDIFTVVTDTVLVYENGERVVEPNELKDVLRALNDTAGLPEQSNIADGYSAFIDDVVDKYYLNPANGESISTFDALTAFMDEFSADKFRISGSDGAVKYLAHDTREISELKPLMTDKELGALIAEQISGNAEVGNYNVMDVTTSEDKLTVILSIGVDDLLPDNVGFLIAADSLFVTAEVDMSEIAETDGRKGYAVSLKINNADEREENGAFDNMLDIVRFFMPEFDIQAQVHEFGVILYDKLSELNSSISFDVGTVIGGAGGEQGSAQASDGETTDDMLMYRFTDKGLEMIDFYTFLANKMSLQLDGDTTAETVKRALQGMYEYADTDGLRNDNNYIAANILRNASSDGGYVWSNDECAAMLRNGGTYSDVEFNGFLRNGVEKIDSDGQVRVEQTIILHAGDSADGASAVRDWANSRLNPSTPRITDGEEYVLITFSMTMEKYLETNSATASGFYPRKVYATLVFKMTEENGEAQFNKQDLIFNDMTYGEYDVVYRLMGLSEESTDTSKVNILSVSNRSADVLNELVTYGDVRLGGKYNDMGIGSIVFSPRAAA